MATFSVMKRASALLFTQTRSILQTRNLGVEASKGQQVEVSHNDTNGKKIIIIQNLLSFSLIFPCIFH